ncbi:U6 snRNA-associated Sm-like protein LSm2 [Perkinsus olseni]|uniref:U6 snRNA-associated Sm-like protein LSm2 n=1 Tax=Perkinsus olseni TaxID=32597 RepID=A0A7J6MY50_PEROL|nr:U6 snRNA-associated Sm-like protein LSm2 [Perkinsus olseni]
MLFFDFFQNLVDSGAQVTVEMKNDVQITGTLQAVDQYFNVKLKNISINNPEQVRILCRLALNAVEFKNGLYPHLLSLRNCFIRGSVVRYIHLPDLHTEALTDQCRKELAQGGVNRIETAK